MLRRLCTLLLVLACALAPALPALELVAPSVDCGCGRSCCGMGDCAMPSAPVRATTTTLTVIGAVEARATVARPASRAIAARALTLSRDNFVSPLRAEFALRTVEAAASAPLYRLHCTFLI
jgi:hypothetical protein